MSTEAAAHDTKFTYEDFCDFPEDGKRHELIDGEHHVTPSPARWHQRIVGNLYRIIANHLHGTKLGEIYLAPFDVLFSQIDVVEPDLLFVSQEHLGILTEKNIQGSPDLVVEILSESTRRRDEIIKRKLYEREGVSEYWIVDPELQTVKVYRMHGEAYRRDAELSIESNDVLQTPLFPGLTLPLAEIFE